MDDLSKQIEEIESLVAIYDDEFQVEDEENRTYSVTIKGEGNDNESVQLHFKFPETYPTLSPPTFEISAPHLNKQAKDQISHLLQDVYLSYVGQSVIYHWVEKIREELSSKCTKSVGESNEDSVVQRSRVFKRPMKSKSIPTIIHGEAITDRKSTFQAHIAVVNSIGEVKLVLSMLRKIKRINQATHNITAYRIYSETTKSFIHDCNDDGENQAGSRLLHLLEIMDVRNAVVVVSRWYGGIQLGPDRFKHINNVARNVIVTLRNSIENNKN